MDGDRSGRGDGSRADDRPDPIRSRLHVFRDEPIDEIVSDLAADVIESLELRLAFEAWADSRE